MSKKRRTWDQLSDNERSEVQAIRAAHQTPAARAREKADREAVEREFPPAIRDFEVPTEDVMRTLARSLEELRRTREEQGLSLSDVSERTGMDRAMISRLETGKVTNPTVSTLQRYARALGKRMVLVLEDEPA
jgi:ribosome-binding protein aMBF1 (putative translation factor)